MLISSVIVTSTCFVKAQSSGTSVTGIIATDTTWTQADSPYTLIGNILVNNGATLTIQPGTTVNLGSYYLMVNGTLSVIGDSGNPVTFNSLQTIIPPLTQDRLSLHPSVTVGQPAHLPAAQFRTQL